MTKIHVPDHVAEAIEKESKVESIKSNEESKTEDTGPYVEESARVLDPTLLDKSILERMPELCRYRLAGEYLFFHIEVRG